MRPVSAAFLALFALGIGIMTGTVATWVLFKDQNQQLSRMYKEESDKATKYKNDNLQLRSDNLILRAGGGR